MSVPESELSALPRLDQPDVGTAPVVLEARGVDKAFRIPEHRIDSFKERAVHPFSRPRYRELKALNGVSFDVHQGEFFGIVGRNGSGKSTLLKILASIYRADAGTIRIGGRVAPFIELGVGFNPDLSAAENVILNAVMMGLTPSQARKRMDAVFEFAELEEFAELKLKNYSSGMSVRLAFSVMLQADADVMLIDEVLAVGDASFQRKCADVFHQMRNSGKTVVLVTHDMSAVQTYCHRAMLLGDGEIVEIGDPEAVARHYFRLNFGGTDAIPRGGAASHPVPDIHAGLVEAHLLNAAAEPTADVEHGEPLRFEAVIEAQDDLVNPVLGFLCVNADGVHVFGFRKRLDVAQGERDQILTGQRVRVSGEIENVLASGRYLMTCWIVRDREPGDRAAQRLDLFHFVVFGGEQVIGAVVVETDVEATVEGEPR